PLACAPPATRVPAQLVSSPPRAPRTADAWRRERRTAARWRGGRGGAVARWRGGAVARWGGGAAGAGRRTPRR
ncbi:MAG TPA: hypothetical protein VLW51_09510, partial [Solirubrobacteraceae bacterium]|nr:hypothetical protein [Solirubrobacteraceae bacterium]